MISKYKYLGCLKLLPALPDSEALANVDAISYDAEALSHWAVEDDPSEKEWRSVAVCIDRAEDVLSLYGHFEDIRRIDNLDRNEAHFWAPLSISATQDPHFPLDCIRRPVVEITYRITTSHARPACHWSYDGGSSLVFLEPVREWQTAALLLSQRNFPGSITGFSFRLYSSWRSTESIEVAGIRFRALLPQEKRGLEQLEITFNDMAPPQRYPVLGEFLPFGVYMHVGTAAKLSELLDISFFDYWRLAFEDIARHHHNCIVLESAHTLSKDDRHVLVDLAENFALKIIPVFAWDMDRFSENGQTLVDEYIKPFADSNGILAWNILDVSQECDLCSWVQARDCIADADPNHPLVMQIQQGDQFPVFAPFFAAAGWSYLKSGAHRALGNVVHTHLPFVGGQQFWITVPTFVYASDAPDWNSSPQLRLMLNQALANGARGWLAHTFHNTPVWVDGQYQRSLTGPFLTFSDLWGELGNRVERLSVLAPLFLSARPTEAPASFYFDISGKLHAKSQLNKDMEPQSVYWFQGSDYYLLYIVNNDSDQVASVNIIIPVTLPDGLEVYDTTALARQRSWMPSDHQRHLEMFPGQGQLFLIAEPPVCEKWRDVIARRIWVMDQQQAKVDLELAHQYKIDVKDIISALRATQAPSSVEGLNRVHAAREKLFNCIYAAPEIYQTRQLLIKASSILCGCDEALAALHGRGRTEVAHEMGIKVIPLAKMLTELRLGLRRGSGKDIFNAAAALVQKGEDIIRDIWRLR